MKRIGLVRLTCEILNDIIFCKSITFTTNALCINLLGKVMLLTKASRIITTAKQVVLVGKEWHFTMKERPSTAAKQVVLLPLMRHLSH